MKRFLYLLIIVGVVALVIILGYYLRYRASAPTPPEQTILGNLPPTQGGATAAPTTGGNPSQAPSVGGGIQAAGQKLGVVTQNQVLDYFVDSQKNVLTIQPDGQVVEISGGSASTLSSSVVQDLRFAEISPDGKKIFVSFGSTLKPQASIFDVATKSWQPLGENIESADWSPDGSEVAYLTPKGSVHEIYLLDISNPKAKPTGILEIRAEDLVLYWVGANQIILSDKASASYAGSILSLDIKKKTLSTIIENNLGLQSIWNVPLGVGLVFTSKYSGGGGSLSLFDLAGARLNGLNFITFPNKCAFSAQPQATPTATTTKPASTTKTAAGAASSTKILYCAAPRDQQKLGISTLPDDYLTRALYTSDNFLAIDLNTGNANPFFADPSQTLDAANLKIFNRILFFVNRYDKKLYAISL